MEIYLNIFDCEMKLNRPVAARAAGQLALKADPNNVQLRESLDGVFSAQNPNLPEAAKKQYAFQPTRKVRPEVWPQALARANNSKLNDVQHAFAELAKADPEDPNVWYNLALTDAWLGDNGRAVEALEKVVALESDESRAAEAWTLAEVLRVGQGMEDQADYVEHSIMVPLRDPQSFVNGLSQLEKAGRIGGMRFDRENGILMGFLLEPAPASILPEQESRQVQGIGAFFMLVSGVVRMWNVQQEKVEASFKVLRDALAPTFGEPHPARGPAKFNDILAGTGHSSQGGLQGRARATAARPLREVFRGNMAPSPVAVSGQRPTDRCGGEPRFAPKSSRHHRIFPANCDDERRQCRV